MASGGIKIAQALISLILLGGTGGFLLSQSLAQVSGPVSFALALISISFGCGLYVQGKSVGRQG